MRSEPRRGILSSAAVAAILGAILAGCSKPEGTKQAKEASDDRSKAKKAEDAETKASLAVTYFYLPG